MARAVVLVVFEPVFSKAVGLVGHDPWWFFSLFGSFLVMAVVHFVSKNYSCYYSLSLKCASEIIDSVSHDIFTRWSVFLLQTQIVCPISVKPNLFLLITVKDDFIQTSVPVMIWGKWEVNLPRLPHGIKRMGSFSKAISIAMIYVSKVNQGSKKLVWFPLIRPGSVRAKAVHPSLLRNIHGKTSYRKKENAVMCLMAALFR